MVWLGQSLNSNTGPAYHHILVPSLLAGHIKGANVQLWVDCKVSYSILREVWDTGVDLV